MTEIVNGSGSPGRNVLVTGGSRGIGRALCIAMSRDAECVALTYNSRSADAEETKSLIEEAGGRASIHRMDVRDPVSVGEGLNSILAAVGHVDVLVNNAGTNSDGLLFDMDEEKFTSVVETNLFGTFRLCRALAGDMMLRRWGRIINLSSVASGWGGRGKSNYAASKAAVNAFTRSIAIELARKGVTANAVAPGMIVTELTDAYRSLSGKELLADIPMKRFGTPEDLNGIVRFLASDAASYITGQVFVVDGGLSIN